MKPAVLVAIGLVLGAIVAALVIAAPILPGVGSDQADRTDAIYYYMIGLCGLIFGVVTVVLVYSVWKFRGDHGDLSDGPPIHGITWLEGLWTAIPTIIVVSIVAISWIVLSDNDDSEASGRINVHIHAYQFGWSYDYVDPEYGIKNSDTLVLPTGVPVRFEITTNDVIHSWWVPDWRLQMNATPGQTNILSVTPKGTGEHDIVCAFLCGIGHAAMNSEVGDVGDDGKPQSLIKRIQVMDQQKFDEWVAGKKQEAQEAAAKPGAEGIAVFNAEGCGGCHSLAAANAAGNVGPSLETSTLQGAAQAANEPLEDFVRQSIVDPSAHIADGYTDIMPKDFGNKIPADQLDQLVALLAGAQQ
jgi:cytochrome c oxidase subunit II